MGRYARGGRSTALSSEVSAGLDKLLTAAKAGTTVTSEDIGAVLAKLPQNQFGVEVYKSYLDCIEKQTVARLQRKGVNVETAPSPVPSQPAKPDYADQRREDILIVHNAVGGMQNYDSINGLSQSLEPPDIEFGNDGITIRETLHPKRRGDDTPATSLVAKATFAQLADRAPFESYRAPRPNWIRVELTCLSSSCFEVTATTGPDTNNYRDRRYSIPISLPDGDEKEKEAYLFRVRRALARLISPSHTDRTVCLEATDIPSSPQCPGMKPWEAMELRQQGRTPY